MAKIVDATEDSSSSLERSEIDSFGSVECDISRTEEVNSQCLMANDNEKEGTSTSFKSLNNASKSFYDTFLEMLSKFDEILMEHETLK